MYHASEENRIYDFKEGIQTEVNIEGNDDINILDFLDSVSIWMERHKELISDKYLPFSIVAVGLPEAHVSAFLYGCFVGRSMEKNKIKVITKKTLINKSILTKKIKTSIDNHISWFKKLKSQIDDKGEDDKDKTKT